MAKPQIICHRTCLLKVICLVSTALSIPLSNNK